MTKHEREVAQRLQDKDGAYAIRYVSTNGRTYYRLRTLDHSPIMNVRLSVWRKMDQRQWVERKEEGKWSVDVSSILGNYDHWKELKAKRDNRKPRAKKAA